MKSEIELTSEQEKVLSAFTQEAYTKWMEQFWAWETLDGMIDGEVIKIVKVSYIDGMIYPADNCRCGSGIRYIFEAELEDGTKISPIGSTCIKTFTGLNDKDVRQIISGTVKVNKERDQILQMLEEFGSFEEWEERFDIAKKRRKLKNFNLVEGFDDQERKLVRKMLRAKLPLPNKFRGKIEIAWWPIENKERVKKFFVEHPEYKEFIDKGIGILENEILKEQCKGAVKALGEFMRTAKRGCSLTPNQWSFAQKLIMRFDDPKMLESIELLRDLKDMLYYYNKVSESDRTLNFIDSMLDASVLYGLSPKQISCILDKHSGAGRPGLKYQFEKELDKYYGEKYLAK